MNNSGARLRAFREFLSLNQEEFAGNLLMSQQNLSHFENGSRDVSSGTIRKLRNTYPNLNIEWLETGEGSMLKNNPKQKDNSNVVNDPEIGYSKQRSLYKSTHTLTYLPMSAMAGFLSVVKDMSPDIEQQFEQVRLPDYNHCDTVIEIDGDSMYPTFSSKDQVICKRKESMRYIETGKPYVINVDGEFVIKRIFDHEQPEKIILRSDNPYYPDQIIEREWIKAIFKIHGVISNNTGERKIIKQSDI